MCKKILLVITLTLVIILLFSIVVSAYEYTVYLDNVLPVRNTKIASSKGMFNVVFPKGNSIILLNGKLTIDDFAVLYSNLKINYGYYFYFTCTNPNISIVAYNATFEMKLEPFCFYDFGAMTLSFKIVSDITVNVDSFPINVSVSSLPVRIDYDNDKPNIDEMINQYIAEAYNDGYTEGVEVGYNSGYSQGNKTGYSSGFGEGSEYGHINGFYAGGDVGYESGITQGEELGYTNGYAAGGDNYKLTSEYEAALAESWNAGRSNGYKAGYEDKSSEFSPLALVISLLTVCELVLVVTVIVKKIRRRKRT